MVEERPFARAGPNENVVDGCRSEPLVEHELLGGVEDPVAGCGAIARHHRTLPALANELVGLL